jgi:hypothetical protein
VAVMLDITSQMRYGDGQGLKEFFLAHRLAHADNAALIATKFNSTVTGFDVSDETASKEWEVLMANLEDGPKRPSQHLKDWLTLHSLIHQAEYDVIGFGIAPDLVSANFANRDEFDQWMLDHQQSHDAVGAALGSTL